MSPVLSVKNLNIGFNFLDGYVEAIHNVSFELSKGKTLAIVGESGCGKTISTMSVLRLLPENSKITGGEIFYDNQNKTLPIGQDISSKILVDLSKVDLKLIVVDYLQLISSSHIRKNASREQEIADISRGLKALAKELNVPVIALAQLSRAVEQRQDKPRLSDLRESGSIEQDADIVMFLHRQKPNKEGKDDEVIDERTNQVEVIIAKHRNGAVHDGIPLHFIADQTRFENIYNSSES